MFRLYSPIFSFLNFVLTWHKVLDVEMVCSDLRFCRFDFVLIWYKAFRCKIICDFSQDF